MAVHAFRSRRNAGDGKNEQALNKKRIYPDIRQAESRYVATILRGTLETSGQWGRGARMPAETCSLSMCQYQAKSSNPRERSLLYRLRSRIQPGASGSTTSGTRARLTPDPIKTDAALKARDPFQNIYSEVANDMLTAREALTAQNRRDVRRVTQLEFAKDLAPQAMGGYLDQDQKGLVTVTRLPATDDPISIRIDRIRERDSGVVDTVNGYYANFADQMRCELR